MKTQKRFLWRTLLAATTVSLVLLTPPLRAGAAETNQPVAVFSFASVDRLMNDVVYLTRTAGRPDIGGLVQMMSPSFVNLLDRTKPAGVVIVMEDGEPKGIGFLPVPDLDKALDRIDEAFGAGIEKLSGGVQRLDLGKGVFLKKQGDWVFFSDEARHLVRLPGDPQKLLEGLNQKYDLSSRLFVQNVPESIRKFAVAKILAAAEAEANSNGAIENPIEREISERMQQQTMASIEDLFNNSDQITVGWAIDAETQKVYLDLSITAVADSELGKQFNELADIQSSFQGFLLPDATATMLLSGQLSSEQIDHIQSVLQLLREKGLEELKSDPNAPPQIREIFEQVAGVLEKTVTEGDVEIGAAVVLAPKTFRFAIGSRVADGKQLAKSFEEIIQLARNEPDVPEVKFRSGKHGDVDFHTFTVPIEAKEEDARKALGEELAVVVGTGPNCLYLAFGEDCTELLKSVLDKSAETGRTTVPPFQLQVAMKPLLSFVNSVGDDPNLVALASALDEADGKDKISVRVTPIDNGFNCRVEVEEGVLQMIGKASKD